MSNHLRPHGLQHARLPCPSPTPGAYSNSGPLSQWCPPTISSSVIPFSSCLQSFPASGFFPNESVLHIRWPKYWSFSFNISPSNSYSGLISFSMDWFDLLALQGTLKSLLQHHNLKGSVPNLDITKRSIPKSLIIFPAENGESLYNQQKQDLELTVAQIMSSLLQNSGLNLKKNGKPLSHSGMTKIKSLMIIWWKWEIDLRD